MSDQTPPAGPRADFTIRPAVPEDVGSIANLIRELAIYEKLDQHARATPDDFRRHLFGNRPYAEVLLAEIGGEPVGLALFFHTFSTFRGQPGIYLEDLFVQPEYRGQGIGKALLGSLAKIAHERNCGRLEWAVLDWNKPAIDFYESLGAGPLNDWITYRIADEPLAELAREAPRS